MPQQKEPFMKQPTYAIVLMSDWLRWANVNLPVNVDKRSYPIVLLSEWVKCSYSSDYCCAGILRAIIIFARLNLTSESNLTDEHIQKDVLNSAYESDLIVGYFQQFFGSGGSRFKDKLRLDAAVPDQVYLERVFDVAAAVRLPDSPLLNEDDLTQVKSGAAHLLWPESEDYVRLRLQITAPECQIVGNDHYTFLLPKDKDSPVFYFNLMPQQIGDIAVIVTLYQEADTLGSSRVRTTVVPQIAGKVHFAVTSEPSRIDFGRRAVAASHTPSGLAPNLHERLRVTLATSPHLASDAALHTLFVDERLAAWCNLIPDNTPNRATRINGLIHTLYDQANTTGDNALILFLHVLADHTDPANILHRNLSNLARDLEQEFMEDMQ